jgi:hypothetical protein
MTIDELKMLLALNGNQRIPYAENEIFGNTPLYFYYITALTEKYDWVTQHALSVAGPLDDLDIKWLAFRYAYAIIGKRWPEAEKIIITNAHYSYHYSVNVIKGRWLEAEHIIASDLNYAIPYMERFGITTCAQMNSKLY